MPDTKTLTDQSPFPAIAAGLRETIDAALPKLSAISDANAAKPYAPGKWSRKQVMGHLTDSAANNHQRFVRVQDGQPLTWTKYGQDHWVNSQHHQERRWDELVAFWHAYNQHIAHVISHLPEKLRDTKVTIGENPPRTLGYIVHDYLVHLKHHLDQVIGAH